jgi:cysteine desulfurase
VLEPCKFLEGQGFEVTYLPIDKYGLVDPEDVGKAITDKTVLISVMHANNEIGTIEPIPEIAKIAQRQEIYFHTDAVQTIGHIPVNVDALGVDLLSISAHKIYGPKGIGALYIRKGTRIVPFMHGGEQERGRRASTENVPAIVGFGKAVEIAESEMQDEMERLTSLRDELIRGLFERMEGIYLNGHPSQRLPSNVNISVEFVEGESMAISLDLDGIAASTGSACASNAVEASHVLLALGLPAWLCHGSLRLSLGRETTREDMERVLEVLPRIVSRLRAMSPFLKSKA